MDFTLTDEESMTESTMRGPLRGGSGRFSLLSCCYRPRRSDGDESENTIPLEEISTEMALAVNSSIFVPEELRHLWRVLPLSCTKIQPLIVYSTEIHGRQLATFFNRVEGYAPTLLFIRTKDYNRFGAFCTGDWADRRASRVFGTGESFVFSHNIGVSSGNFEVFRWVGTLEAREVKDSEKVFQSMDKREPVIGDGAIHLKDMHSGTTVMSSTYGSPALQEDMDFEIDILEVVAFPPPGQDPLTRPIRSTFLMR